MKYWSIPRLWDGQTVAILASGPSMSQAVADQCRGIPTIAINTTFRLAPWADMLYAADEDWWKLNPGAREFAGLKVTCMDVRGVLVLRNAGRVGYSDDVDCVHSLGNSGAQAIQIAAKAGAKRILLCGFDMHGGHWHGKHPQGLRNAEPEALANWCLMMEPLAKEMTARGIEVINCTPGSALTCFPMGSLDHARAV